MRLANEQRTFLKDFLKVLSDEAKIYLFGSRVDDNKKGGDIDLLIVSKKITKKDIRKLRIEFFKRFGEQKIDIVLYDGISENPFVKAIKDKVLL